MSEVERLRELLKEVKSSEDIPDLMKLATRILAIGDQWLASRKEASGEDQERAGTQAYITCEYCGRSVPASYPDCVKCGTALEAGGE